AARALQGIGASLLMPGTLSILTVTFPIHERARAIGIWSGVSGLALALGPTAGGWLVEHAGWQSVFFLNVPIGTIGLIVASRVVRESKAPEMRKLDLPGLGLGTAGLFSMTYGLIEANQKGWSSPAIIASLVGAAALLVAFIDWEARNPAPMLPLRFFRIPAFSAGATVAFSLSLGMFGTFFFMSLYMQLVRGYSAFETGVRILPITGMIVLVAPNAGKFAQKHGSKIPMVFGLTLAGTGLFLLSRLGATTPYPWMIPPLMIMGMGMASTMTPMTAAVMNAVGPQRAGLGSATTNTAREVGGVFGIALLGTLLTQRLRDSLAAKLVGAGVPPAMREPILASAGHGRIDPQSLSGVDPSIARAVGTAFRSAFLDGFHLALMVASGILFVAAIVAWRWIPSGAPGAEASWAPSDSEKALAAV
ncbi:MAG: MFS transporter, partial [Actinomycetota bacterium]